MNPFARFPFLRFILPLTGGIILAEYISLPGISDSVLLAISSVPVILLTASRKIRLLFNARIWFGLILEFSWLMLGYWLSKENPQGVNRIPSNSEARNWLIRLKEPPVRKSATFMMHAEVMGIIENDSVKSINNEIILSIPISDDAARLACDDRIMVNGICREIDGPKNPGEFSYREYMARQGIYCRMLAGKGAWRIYEQGDSNSVWSIVYRCRDFLLQILRTYISEDKERGVASALLFGYKDDLDNEIVQAYTSTGTLHILAVSGMHVAILYWVVSFLLKPFQKFKLAVFTGAAATIILIWFYSLLSGMSPSIVRASVMFTIIVLGKALRNDISIYNNLFASAVIILVYNPWFLFDAGFQLSYLAVFGIVYLQPAISSAVCFRHWISRQAWSLITVSVAAQIATFPISIYYFGQFPNYFILANLIVIPITSLVMYLGIALVCFFPFHHIAEMLGWLINKTILLVDTILLRIQSLPGSVTSGLYLDKTGTMIFYGIISCLLFYFSSRSKISLYAGLALIGLLIALPGIPRLRTVKRQAIIINSVPKTFCIQVIENKRAWVFTQGHENDTKLKARFRNYWNAGGVNAIAFYSDKDSVEGTGFIFTKDYLISQGNTIYFAGKDNMPRTRKALVADYLVLHEGCSEPFEKLVKEFTFRVLVVDGTVTTGKRREYLKKAKEWGIEAYDLTTSGALIIDN
jgi:competence protein ComEC